MLALRDMQGIVVIGSGAREHAILWGLAQQVPQVPLYAAPGNPGMEQWASCLGLDTVADIVQWASQQSGPLLVIIGPEGPLAEGLSDHLRAQGHVVVGPSKEAARLESSKAFAKEFMDRHHIPTARWTLFHDPSALAAYTAQYAEWPLVLKQSRLAQGKGVVVAADETVAKKAIAEWSEDPTVYDDGVIAEACLVGREVSVHILTNGQDYVWMPLAQDYKRLSEDPQSPNTGGMGAYAPVTWLTDADRKAIQTAVLDPLMQAIQKDHLLYRGVLYVGIMMTAQGPMVLEFNVRMGDPETEVIIPILDVDWIQWWWELGQGHLHAQTLPEPARAAVAVVLASDGYPKTPRRGQPLAITPTEEAIVFQAATRRDPKGQLQANGGRVLTVVGLGASISEARRHSYQQVTAIDFPFSCMRHDIALEALE
ncbi:MAG: phosphoribosylamine--glycine ligase [Sulfobacillus thermotolerans]|nr:phosphoribosylamine--glycine ligase [Sulfobacillus thermotolerans]